MFEPSNATIPSPKDVDVILAQIFATPEFQRSERMRTFLSYVVTETLAGQGESIRAKTIAQDIYDRDPSNEDYNENIVRVDARRLRRHLELFYSAASGDSRLRISIPVGSYMPIFEQTYIPDGASPPSVLVEKTKKRSNMFVAGAVACICLIAFGVFYFQQPTTDAPVEQASTAERLAIFDKSGALLQADNLCLQGRGLLFPIAEPEQQAIASDLFRRAVALAPEYACGYAGAAHSITTQALMAPDEAKRLALLAEAKDTATRAQALDPTDGWAVSGLAWAVYGARDLDRAVELSKRSEELSPVDGNVLDFHALISLLVRDYEEAQRAADPQRERNTIGLAHAHRNIFGVASFHAGSMMMRSMRGSVQLNSVSR